MATVAEFAGAHRCVGVDTSVFIYYYERVEAYCPAARALFSRIAVGAPRTVTSVISLTELNAKPLALGRRDLANRYTAVLLRFPNLSLVGLDIEAAQAAAELRGRHNLRTADALQMAACLQAGATGFITNDHRLRRAAELDVLILEDTDDVRGRS
ncbi:MAG: type II toxin-antitoxin system VapC family toxin [Chloroflexi bacterium]|nr:type II toxin-antitoxin system VapC family toxin [Chloroflexota bacterium]